MSTYCGKYGKVVIGSGTHELAEAKEFSLELSNEVIQTPSFQQMGRTKKVCGPYDWKGSISCYWDMTDTTGQKVLHDATISGATVAVKLYVFDDDVGTPLYYSGNVYIPSQSITVKAEGAVSEVSFNFEGSGDLTATGF